MKTAFRTLIGRMSRLAAAATAAALLAVVTVAAQSTFETFDPGFEGELWEMVQTLAPPAEGGPVNGIVFTEANGYLYVSDSGNGSVVVYDFDRNVVELPDADWAIGQSEDSSSPVYGWEPNQMSTATLEIDGEAGEQTAILVSDFAEGAHRVLAFTTTGTHLFTIGLDSTGIDPRDGFINGVAMGPGAKFILEPNARVRLVGSFAAAWSEGAREVGGTLVHYGTVDSPYDFIYDAGDDLNSAGDDRFEGSPVAVLTADEQVVGVPDAVPAVEPFGLTFDTLGNLYMTDSMTERLTAYSPGPNFTRLFTFGTPDPEDGGATTIEFFQSFGIRFWPDPAGTDGRLFVADAINNRVVAYRPNLAGKTLDSIFELDGIGQLDGFPYGLGIDPSSGRMAIGDDFGQQVWILKTPDLAAFDVRVLDEGGAPTEVVCVGATYTVRFSLTVPAGRNPVSNVVPQLLVDGTPTMVPPQPGQPGGYPSTPLEPGDVMTFSYELTAPLTAGAVELEAGVDLASQGSSHVLNRQITLPVSSCLGAAPEIVATASPLPQLSGWTAIRPGVIPTVTLLATDPNGVLRIDYQIEGTNHTIPLDPVFNSDPQLTEQTLEMSFSQMGVTTVEYAAWNSNHVKSELQILELNMVAVPDRTDNEGDSIVPFTIGAPAPGSGVTFSATGLPGDLTIDQDSGVISGTLPLPYDSAGTHVVTVTESRDGDQPTSVTFNWTINDVNRLPVSGDDSYAIDEDGVLGTTAVSGLLANDSDPDGVLVVGWSDHPAHGSLVVNPDGSFTYTPVGDFSGTDTFHYRSNDGQVDSNLATVTITVNAVNDRPSVAGTAAAVDEDNTLTATLPAAVDPDSSSLTYAKATDPAHGTVTVNSDGSYTYQPAPGYSGADSFTFVVNDGAADSEPATVTITVNAVNDAPASADDVATVNEGGLVVVDVLANDTDADGGLDPSTVTIVTGPAHGLVTVGVTGTITYSHDGGETTSDSFTYKVSDAAEFGAAATVLITVTPVNDAPVVSNVVASVDEDEVLLGGLPAATDSDSSNITYAKATDPAHGTVTVAPDGSYTYTPALNYNGSDLFSYTANDGSLTSAPAVVTITVNPVLDPPVAFDGSESVDEDNVLTATLPVGSDPDGSSLLYFLVGAPSHGTVEVDHLTGAFTYAPSADFAGTDSFTYEANDHTAGSVPATITITVNPVNDAPVASDGTGSVTEDGTLNGTLTATDVDSTDLTFDLVTGPAHGTVVFGPNGSYIYEPAEDYNGGDSFTFTANDGFLASNLATVTIAVTPVGDAPVVSPGSGSVNEDGMLTATLPVAEDADSTDLTYALASPPTNGTATVALDGSYAYTPSPNFHGTDTFTYTASDGSLTGVPATITITVNGVNDAPSFTAGTVPAVNEDAGTQSIAWATAISAGPQESAQTVTFVATSDNSALFATQPAISPTGVLTYATAPNAFGNATVTVVLQDNGGTANGGVNQSAPVTFTIAVSAVNDAPVAANDTVSSVGAAPVSISVLANDADLDGGVLSLSSFTQPATGGVVTSSGDQLVFTPTPGFAGTVTFTYTVIDGQGGSSTAGVTVTITGDVCTGPVTALIRKQVTVNSGSLIEGSVHVMTAVDVTFNGGTLAGDLLMLGTPLIQVNGTPAAYAGNIFGTGAVSPTSHRVTINSGTSLGYVISRTDAVALPTVAAPPASAGTRSVTLNNSTESPGDFATLRDLTLNSNVGPIAVPPGTYRTFTANSNTAFVIGVAGATTPSVYNFQSLTLNSGSSLQVVGPVIVTVKNSVAFNGPAGNTVHPEWLTLRVASTGGLALNSGSSLYGYAEVPNGPVTINSGTELVGGLAADKLTMNSNGRLILRPACQTNQAPTMSASDRSDTSGSTVSVQMAGSDPDNDSLTYTATGLPPGVSMTSDGLISGTLTTAGVYTVTVTATDSSNAIGTATFVWTVAAPNQLPTAQNDSASSVGTAPVTIAVLSNDTDPDGGTLNLVSYTQPTGGTVTASGNLLIFTPNPGFAGTATFSYVVSDGQGGTATGTVSVTVTASNQPPVCSATVSPGLLWPPNHKKVYLTLSGIIDPDGDPLAIRFTSIQQDEPTNGPGQGNTMQDGGIEYAGKKAWVRAERSGTGDGRVYLIAYTATDPDGASCTGQVTVGVPHDQSGSAPVLSPGRWNSLTGALVSAPPAPAAVNDSATVAGGDDQNIAVLANDIAHGLALTVTIVSQPAKGTVRVNADGTINYDAPSNWSGTTSFTYKVSNGFTTSVPATVTVIVTRSSPDDDDCGDRNHDHGRDHDGRDRDHRRGDHDRCRHSDGDRDRDNDRNDDRDHDRDNDRDNDHDDDCGDRNHDHGRDNDNRDRDHRRGDHRRCNHRR